MFKKVISLCVMVSLLCLCFSGCSSKTLKENNITLNNEIISVKQKNTDLEKKVSELNSENEKLSDKVKNLESNNSAISENMIKFKDNVYPLYTANYDSFKKESYLWIYIDEKSPVKDKLDILSKALSKVYFGNLPIEVSGVKNINGKKIAVVNLKESEENQKIKETVNFKGTSWASNYFQGSTGGNVTSTSLIETMLQRDYNGTWIDGVTFLYNGKKIEFEHVPDLSDTIYR